MQLARMTVDLVARTDAFLRDIDGAVKQVSAFGDRLTDVGKSVTTFVSAPLAALGAVAFANTLRVGELADQLGDLAQQTGLSTDTLQEFQHIANVGGDELSAFTDAARMLGTRLNVVGADSDALTETLTRLGIQTKDAQGNFLSMDAIFPAILAKLAGINNITERNSLAFELFGRSASALAPALGMSAEEMDRLRAEAHRLGLVIGDDAIEAADNFGAEWRRMKESLSGAANSIGAALVPMMTSLATLMNDTLVPLLQKVTKFIGGLTAEQQTWIAVLGGVVAATGPVLVGLGAVLTIMPQLTAAAAILGGATGLGLIPIALASVTAAGVALVKHWDDLKEATVAWAIAIKSIVVGMWESIKLTFTNAINAIWGPFKAGIDKIKGAFEWLSDIVVGHSIVPDMWDMIADSFRDGADRITTTTSRAADGVISAVEGMHDGVVPVLDGIFGGGFSNMINSATSTLSGFFSFLGGSASTIASGGIAAALSSLFGGITDAIFNGASRFRQAVDAWKEAVDRLLDNLDDQSDRIFGREPDKKRQMDRDADDARDTILGDLPFNGTDAQRSVWNAILDALSGNMGDLDVLGALIEWATSVFGSGSPFVAALEEYRSALQQITNNATGKRPIVPPITESWRGAGGGATSAGATSAGGAAAVVRAPVGTQNAGKTVNIYITGDITAGWGSTPEQIAGALRRAMDNVFNDDTNRSFILAGDGLAA